MARKALAAVEMPSEEFTDSDSFNEPNEIAPGTIEQKIAEAAYYKAEKRGFAPGYEMQDWLDAEREIKAKFGLI